MNKSLNYDPDYQLWAMMTQVRYAIFRLRQLELTRYDITPEQVGILVSVEALGEKATPAEIARWRLKKPNTISSIVDRMVKRGLVVKNNDLHRKDMVRVSLTGKGKELHDILTGRNVINEVLSVLSEDDKKQLEIYMETLRNKAFKDLGISYKPVVPSFLDNT
jgi:MarR family transcriptional regulator, 2-MHQ and catechol-resistance regulon repressor